MHKESDFFKDIKPLTKYTQPMLVDSYSLPHTSYKRNKQNHSTGLWVFVIIGILVLFWAISMSVSVARVWVKPKIDSIAVNESVVLFKNETNISPILYETINLDTEIPETKILSEKVDKKEKATGSVTFYNSYANTPQKLIKNTRLENSKGNIYTLDTEVIVPGFSIIDNKKVPGTTTVSVSAFAIGENYNSDPDTLKVIALKGGPKYDTLFAKNTKPITGGLDGTYYTTASNQNADALVVTPVLAERLNELVQKQIPENYVYIPGLSIVTLNQSSTNYSKVENTKLSTTGNIEQIVLEKESFIRFLESKNIDLSKSANLDFTSLKGTIGSREDSSGDTKFSVTITGTIQRENVVDEQALKEKLVGVHKKDFNEVMATIPNSISSAELSIRPFWIFSIPKSFNRINIIHTNGS